MRYELDLIHELCREIGLSARMVAGRLRYAPYAGCHRVEVDLGQGAVLCFQNSDHEPDCLIGFLTLGPRGGANDNRSAEDYEFTGVDWHTHFGKFTFTDARGHYVELDYLDLAVGLKEGRVLVCEREVEGRTADRLRWPTRWLIHSEYADFRDLQEGERIVVRRAVTHPAETSRT